MRPLLLLLAFFFAAPLAMAQPITLVPYGGPLGGNVDGLEVTTSGTIVMLQDERLFASDDGGATWTMPLGNVKFVSLGKMRSDTLVARASEVYVSADGLDWHVHSEPASRSFRALRTEQGWFVTEREGVFRSTDEGVTWEKADNGRGSGERTTSVFASPDGRVFLTTFASFFSSGNRSKIYVWQDGVWVSRTIAPDCGSELSISTPGFASDGRGIAFARGERRQNTLEGESFYTALVTTDGGASWQCPAEGISAVAVGPDGLLYRARYPAGDAEARIEFSSNGTDWTRLGLEGVTTTVMRFLPDGTLLAGSGRFYLPDAYEELYGTGLYRVSRRGEGTRLVPEEATSRAMALKTIDGAVHVATPHGIFRRAGTAWEPVEAENLSPYEWPGMPGYTRLSDLIRAPWGAYYYITSPLAIPTKQGLSSGSGIVALGDSILLVGETFPMRRSENRGRTWENVDLDAWQFLEADGLLAAGEGIWHSSDLGATWEQVWHSDTLRVQSITSNEIGGVRRTYARVLNYRTQPFLIRSIGPTDSTMTWERVPESTAPVQGMGWSGLLLTSDQRLLFAARLSLYVSSDEGVTWEQVYAADEAILSYHPGVAGRPWPFTVDAEGYLVVASDNGGLLRSATPVPVEPDERPAGLATLAVAPNPASGVVQIRAGAAEGRVEIFDLLGRRVALVAEGAVLETVSWDASALPAGLYFVRLTTAARTETTPMVVVR